MFHRHHLSHLNIPERVAPIPKLDSFSSSCSKKAWHPLSNKGWGGGVEKGREKEKNDEKMQQVSDI